MTFLLGAFLFWSGVATGLVLALGFAAWARDKNFLQGEEQRAIAEGELPVMPERRATLPNHERWH